MQNHSCFHNTTLTGGQISADPTSTDTNYRIGFIGWTPANKAFLHVGSGTWIDITAKPPEPGNGASAYKKAKHVGK